jgi:hypothetical protein
MPGPVIVLAVTTMTMSMMAVRNAHAYYAVFFIPSLRPEYSAEIGLLTLFV